MKSDEKALPVSKLDDPDMQATPAAMERPVRRAHRDAHRHGTGVLVVENGKMVEVDPDPALYEGPPDGEAVEAGNRSTSVGRRSCSRPRHHRQMG